MRSPIIKSKKVFESLINIADQHHVSVKYDICFNKPKYHFSKKLRKRNAHEIPYTRNIAIIIIEWSVLNRRHSKTGKEGPSKMQK